MKYLRKKKAYTSTLALKSDIVLLQALISDCSVVEMLEKLQFAMMFFSHSDMFFHSENPWRDFNLLDKNIFQFISISISDYPTTSSASELLYLPLHTGVLFLSDWFPPRATARWSKLAFILLLLLFLLDNVFSLLFILLYWAKKFGTLSLLNFSNFTRVFRQEILEHVLVVLSFILFPRLLLPVSFGFRPPFFPGFEIFDVFFFCFLFFG